MIRATLPLLPLCWSLAAQVQPVEPPQDRQQKLADLLEELTQSQQLRAAGKTVQDLAAAPGDVVVLSARDLRALGYRTLGDALGGVLGFHLNEDRAYQGLGVRGLYVLGDQNTRVLIMQDGHALNSPGDLGSSKVDEDFGLPLELVDHVEIVRGPASSLYGNNAFQALVNVVSTAAAQSQGTALVAGASLGTGGRKEGWIQGCFQAGGTSFSLMASGLQRTGTALDLPELAPQRLPAEADREVRDSVQARIAHGSLQFAAYALDRTQRLALSPYEVRPGDPSNRYGNRRLGGELRWEPRQERAHWTFRLYGDRQSFQGHFMQDPARLEGEPGGAAFDRVPDRSLGTEIQGRFLLGETFTLTAGTEQRLHRIDHTSSSAEGANVVRSDLAFRIGNTYTEAEWRPHRTWTLVAGLQLAEWTPNRLQVQVGEDSQALEQRATRRVTPRVAAIWQAGGSDVVKLLHGQGFRLPTVFERYYTDNESQTANPSLAPEVITSTQAVWNRRWTSRLRTQFSLSAFRWEHFIAIAADTPLAQFRNSEMDQQGRAFEGEITYRGSRLEWYGGWGSYRWSSGGRTFPNAARQGGVVRVIHRVDSGSLALEARHTGAREDQDRGVRVPSSTCLRASFRRELPRGWVQLSVEDLLNDRRQDLVSPEYAPLHLTRADGRRALLSAGLRF